MEFLKFICSYGLHKGNTGITDCNTTQRLICQVQFSSFKKKFLFLETCIVDLLNEPAVIYFQFFKTNFSIQLCLLTPCLIYARGVK